MPSTMVESAALSALRERLAAVEHRSASGSVPTGWSPLDDALSGGGLRRNCVHEWIGLSGLGAGTMRGPADWSPPLMLLLHVARQSVLAAEPGAPALHVCWIGRRVWPSVHSLARAPARRIDLLARSLFVDARGVEQRVWAIDMAARCPSVLTIADGSGLDMSASRRVQLATEAGGWMTLLARPPWEEKELSGAATRWTVARELSESDRPRYRVGLRRCKGMRSTHALDRTFILQREGRDGLVVVPAAIGHGSCAHALAG